MAPGFLSYARVLQGVLVAPAVLFAGAAVLFLGHDELGIFPRSGALLAVLACGLVGLAALVFAIAGDRGPTAGAKRLMIASGLAIGLVAAIALAATWKPAAIIVIGPAVLALWKLVKLSRVDGRIQPRTWGAICASALVAAGAIAAQPILERRAVPTGRDELVRNLGTAISAGDRVALATVPGFDFAWDRVHFIGAYTGRTAVVERLGTSPGFGWSSRVHSYDGITLVVFLNKGRAMTYFDFPANLGSLQPLATRTAGFAREDSVFTVRRLPNGWVELHPQE